MKVNHRPSHIFLISLEGGNYEVSREYGERVCIRVQSSRTAASGEGVEWIGGYMRCWLDG